MKEPQWCAAVSHAPLVVVSLVLGILLIIVAFALREPEDARKWLRLALEWFRPAWPRVPASSPAPLPGSRAEPSRGWHGTGDRDSNSKAKAKIAAAYRRYFYDHPPLYKQVTLNHPAARGPCGAPHIKLTL